MRVAIVSQQVAAASVLVCLVASGQNGKLTNSLVRTGFVYMCGSTLVELILLVSLKLLCLAQLIF